jgi:formylglycine-generating enzyme required for sulfatase activity
LNRVYLGGGWNLVAARCRSAFRGYDQPALRGFGFRLALNSASDSN